MKIKLIAPARKPEWGESFWDLKTFCKLTGRKGGGAPLALPTIAALTPADVEVVLTDENVEPINFEEKTDLVGITGMTCVIPRSYEIADEYRKRGVPVVMGGIHVSMLPEEAIQHCDSVVIGEAEEIWQKVVRDAQKKKLEKFYRAPRFPDLTNTPIPRWDLLKFALYPIFPIQTGRGCPFDCEFCSVQIFNGREYRCKDIKNILEEVKFIKTLEYKKPLFFVDDNILAVKNYAKKLFESLIPFNIKWWCQTSVSSLKDDETLDLMYKSGCRYIFIGFESISQDSLDSMRKSKTNKAEEYKFIIDKVHAHKIAIFGSFILGSDTDNESVFDLTSKFIYDTGIAFAMVNILTPPPGTELYKRLNEKKRILLKPWWQYDGESVCLLPKLMQPEILEKKRNGLLQDIYSYDKCYNRLNNLWTKNVFTRNANQKRLFSRGRILFTITAFINSTLDFKRINFIFKGLWNPKVTSVIAILLSLNFHDYAYKKRKAIRNIKFGSSNKNFFLDLISYPHSSLIDKNDVVYKVKELIKFIWGNPGKLIEDWIHSADVLALSYKNKDLRGFSIVNYVENNIFYLRATIIHPEDINQGLGKFMNYHCVKSLLNEKGKTSRPWMWLENIYFISCISNPLAYAILFKKRKIYPDLENRYKLSNQDKEIAFKVAKRFCPNAVFDTETFVLKGDLTPYPDLIYKKENIPWSNDKRINQFFEDRLKLTQEQGNTLLVLWKENLFLFLLKAFIYKSMHLTK